MADDKVKAAKPAVGSSGAVEAAKATEAEVEEVEDTIIGKIQKSGLYFVRDHSSGLDYVGVSPQNDPDASEASKLRSSVIALDVHPPRTGLQIRPKEGEAFAVAEGFGPDATVEDWTKVLSPSGVPLFA